MAGFDLDTQHSYVIPGGGRGEAGYYSFCSGAETVEVPTRMVTVYDWRAQAQPDTNGLKQHVNSITSDMSISSGAVTFRRHATKLDVSLTFQYELKGW